MKIGDKVGYVSVIGDQKFQHVGKVYDIWENGIPSCKEPMVKIEGKAGCVLMSHCIILEEPSSVPARATEGRGRSETIVS